MQSEGGAAGALHGALQTGALATTFTASQGLLLMLPNMFKIAGELTPFVMHVAARTAGHARPVDLRRPLRRDGGSHDRVRDARVVLGPGGAGSGARRPRGHPRDPRSLPALLRRLPHLARGGQDPTSGRRRPARADLGPLVREHRARALSPAHPVLRGSAQNPDVFFQAREASNPFYALGPRRRAERDGPAGGADRASAIGCSTTSGHPEAERVLVLMGSGCGAAEEAVEALVDGGERVGVVKVRLFRPFSPEALVAGVFRPPCGRSPCSIARRSPVRPESRCTRTWSRRSTEEVAAGRARFSVGCRA